MKVLDRTTIQTRLLLALRSRDSTITYFGPGPIRAFFYAIAVELQHLYYRLFRADLKQDPLRAVGTDLDEIGQSRGISRLGASQSSAVLTFTGTVGASIAHPFTVRTTSGQIYGVTAGGTILADSSNPGTYATVKLIAQSVNSGSVSSAAKDTINQVVSFSGVSGGTLQTVTNEAPSVGGADAETDDQYRSRIVNFLASLNQGTRAFYNAAARTIDSTVVRTIVGRSADPHVVKLLLVSRSGATYTSNQLSSMAATLGPLVPVLATVNVDNIVFTPIAVTITGTISSGFVARDVVEQIARRLNQYMDWSQWPFSTDVQWAHLLAIASNTAGVADIASFSPLMDVAVLVNSLPKMTSISFTDATTLQITTLSAITGDFPVL